MPDAPKNRAELLRVMADHVWEQERNRKITEYWRATADYDAIHVRMRLLLRAIEAAGCSVQPNEPTEGMLVKFYNTRGIASELIAAALAAGPFREG